MDDIVIDYNDIEIIDYGDEKYISISLTSSSDEGYRTLYGLTGFNPKDYDEVKDNPEAIADFYLQIFPDGNLKIDGNPLNAEDSKFFNKELHMSIWDRYIADSFKEIQPDGSHRPYGTSKELDKLIDDKVWVVRREVARQGYGLDRLVNDEDWHVREAVAKQGYGLDKLINDKYSEVRIAVAEQGYGLDKLVEDRHIRVRIAVAKQGYRLDKLVDDRHYWVRMEVARQGYGLDGLVNDENWEVRRAVAEQGYGLDRLINDEYYMVRVAVAEQGYGLDKLVDDENAVVRSTVKEYLKENKYKNVDEWKKDNPDKTYYKDDKSKGEER